MARSRTSLALPRAEPVLALALLTAVATAVGLGLGLLGVAGPVPAAALLAANLTLLALVVALNAVLRLQGLGGDGVAGAAGVLGSSLVLLGRALALLRGPDAAAGVALFERLDLAGFLLTAWWVARSGWAVRHLVGPPALLGGSSLAAAGLTALLAEAAYLRSLVPGVGSRLVEDSLPFVPLGLWGVVLAGFVAFGRPASLEEPAAE